MATSFIIVAKSIFKMAVLTL